MASSGSSSVAQELVEIIDTNGRVLEVVTRKRMRSESLRHRSTYVVVTRPAGLLVVHKRAKWKDINPGLWDIAFGGVAGVGEPWVSAARRELAEEAGLENVDLTSWGYGSWETENNRVLAALFVAVTSLELSPADGEVVATDEVPLTQLEEWLNSVAVCQDSVALLGDQLRLLAIESEVGKAE